MNAAMIQTPITPAIAADLAREWRSLGINGNATARRNPKGRRSSDLLEEARFIVYIRSETDTAASIVGFTNDEADALATVRRFNETIRRAY